MASLLDQNEEFRKLSPEAQKIVKQKFDAGFASLSPEAKNIVTSKLQPNKPSPLMETLKTEGERAMLGPIGSAVKETLDLPSTARRAVLTGAGGLAGEVAGPAGAAVGAAVGGTVADIADKPKESMKFLADVGKGVAQIPSNPVEGIARLNEAFKGITPEEVKTFGKRRALEGSLAGMGAGISKALSALPAKGPLTATISKPGLVFEKTREATKGALAAAKQAAKGKVVDPVLEKARLFKGLGSPQGRAGLASDAIITSQQGLPASGNQLLAWRSALGQHIGERGGTFADEAIEALNWVKGQLENLAPGINEAFDNSVRAIKASGGSPKNQGSLLSSFLKAIFSPRAAAQSSVLLPGVRRGVGAAIGAAGKSAPGTLPAAVSALDNIRRGQVQ